MLWQLPHPTKDIERAINAEDIMTKRKITVTTGSLKDMGKEFVNVWHQAEAGKKIKGPIERIVFENERLLFKTLTPKRCDLLKYVHENGKISIRALAKQLHRDYSNVHDDVKTLHHVGLILKDDKDDKYYVPWETITTEIPLCTKTSLHHDHANRHWGEHRAHGK